MYILHYTKLLPRVYMVRENGVTNMERATERPVVELSRDYSKVPEEYRPREYGYHETRLERLGDLICVSQVRQGPNPERESLGNSIEQQGLLNQIDVALLGAEPFEDYIRFVNRVWKSKHDIVDFTPDDDGLYHLVIAGHSRVDVITDKAAEKQKAALDEGYDTSWEDTTIWAKIHYVSSPQEILAIQMAENIHREPSEERRAVALVETYHYGLEVGWWNSKKAFLEQTGDKFTPIMLNRALLFQQLSNELRELVMSNKVQYGVAIEVARLHAPFVQRYGIQKYGADQGQIEAGREDAQKAADEYVGTIILKADSGKWSITKAREHVNDYLNTWRGEIKELEIDLSGKEPEELQLFDVENEFIVQQRLRSRRLKDASKKVTERALRAAATASVITTELIVDPEVREERLQEITESLEAMRGDIRTYIKDITTGKAGETFSLTDDEPRLI